MKQKNPLNSMEKTAKQIKKIRFIRNTILANACYHSKEMENQLKIADKIGNLTDEEYDAITKSWGLCNNLAQQLIKELRMYIDDETND